MSVPLSLWRLLLIALPLGGVNFCWSIQYGYSSPQFLELGMPSSVMSYAWLAGPVSGILVQPIVGALSDRCTLKWGRRRPFIAAGAVAIALALEAFANAEVMGRWLGDTATHTPRALAIAVVGFWLLDFSNNVLQGPIRTLMADLVPASQQALGNSCFSFVGAIGSLCGYLVGSLRLVRAFPFMGSDIQALYTVGLVVILVTTAITVATVHETPLTMRERQRDDARRLRQKRAAEARKEERKKRQKQQREYGSSGPGIINVDDGDGGQGHGTAAPSVIGNVDDNCADLDSDANVDGGGGSGRVVRPNSRRARQSGDGDGADNDGMLATGSNNDDNDDNDDDDDDDDDDNLEYDDDGEVLEIDPNYKFSLWQLVPEMWRGAKELPGSVRRVFAVQVCTWFAWFTMFMLGTTWIGANIYGGNPRAPKGSHERELFDHGVRVGNLGLTIQQAVATGYSVLLPTLLQWFGVRRMYFFQQLVQGGLLLSTPFITTPTGGVAVLAALGVPFASTFTIPWAISCAAVQASADAGLFLALMNLSQAAPEILSAFFANGVLELYHDRYYLVLAMGGVAALIGMVLVLLLIRPHEGGSTPGDAQAVAVDDLVPGNRRGHGASSDAEAGRRQLRHSQRRSARGQHSAAVLSTSSSTGGGGDRGSLAVDPQTVLRDDDSGARSPQTEQHPLLI